MKKNLSLKAKLVGTFLAIGTVPLLVSNFIAYQQVSNEIETQSNFRLTTTGADIAYKVQAYFKQEKTSLVDLAASPYIADSILDFSKAFLQYTQEEFSPEQESELIAFYQNEFGKKYENENPGQSFSASSILNKMDTAAKIAQWDYLANNGNPLGSKDNLSRAEREIKYSRLHEQFHPTFREYLTHHKLYDLFLVDADGRLVYSVYKETDYATSLTQGPWADSGLARAFKKTRGMKKSDVALEDFASYSPSYEAPASFLSTPIYKDSQYVGALIIQLPLDEIGAIASSRDALGENGQTLLVGADGRLRADAFRGKEEFNVGNSFRKNNPVLIETPAIQAAMAEKSQGVIRQVSYDGLETTSYYNTFEVAGERWYIAVELDDAELYAGLNHLTQMTIWVVLGSLLAICFVAFATSRGIGGRLMNIIGQLERTGSGVTSASDSSAKSATELSEAATEQAANLQETMASVEQISAMINQNAESASTAQNWVEKNSEASKEGQSSVEDMLSAIEEIRKTNDEIVEQMSQSNREFGEIVKIISEIGDKTQVINDIVFQTKLLSFNASVEAARAGEHGKGFAVVAEEVGNLAAMSGSAANEITEMLSNSITKVNEIVNETTQRVDRLVEVGKDKVSLGQSTAEKCDETLRVITNNAAKVREMVIEISNASTEQAQGVKEINRAISQLDQVTQQNSAVANQSSDQAESLKSEAAELQASLGYLRAFIEGGSSSDTLNRSYSERQMKTTSSSNFVDHGAPVTQAPSAPENVIPMKAEPKQAAQKPVDDPQQETAVTKMAAGSDLVPSADDDDFEDF